MKKLFIMFILSLGMAIGVVALCSFNTNGNEKENRNGSQAVQSLSRQGIPPRNEWNDMVYIDGPEIRTWNNGKNHGIKLKIRKRKEYQSQGYEIWYRIHTNQYINAAVTRVPSGCGMTYDRDGFVSDGKVFASCDFNSHEFVVTNCSRPNVSFSDFWIEVLNVIEK